MLGAASDASGDLGGHAIGVAHALDAGAGIRASTVHDDGAGDALAPFEMALRDQDRRGLRQVGREDPGGRCMAVGGEHRQVERRGRGFDAAVERRGTEALGAVTPPAAGATVKSRSVDGMSGMQGSQAARTSGVRGRAAA